MLFLAEVHDSQQMPMKKWLLAIGVTLILFSAPRLHAQNWAAEACLLLVDGQRMVFKSVPHKRRIDRA